MKCTKYRDTLIKTPACQTYFSVRGKGRTDCCKYSAFAVCSLIFRHLVVWSFNSQHSYSNRIIIIITILQLCFLQDKCKSNTDCTKAEFEFYHSEYWRSLSLPYLHKIVCLCSSVYLCVFDDLFIKEHLLI